MIIKVDDVLAAILEAEISKAKAKFNGRRAAYVDRINRVIFTLQDVINLKANEKNLLRAYILINQARYASFIPGRMPGFEDSFLRRMAVDVVKSAVENLAVEDASKRGDPMTRDELVEELKLSPKAAAAYDRGATIGELFVIQPDLFL